VRVREFRLFWALKGARDGTEGLPAGAMGMLQEAEAEPGREDRQDLSGNRNQRRGNSCSCVQTRENSTIDVGSYIIEGAYFFSDSANLAVRAGDNRRARAGVAVPLPQRCQVRD
jgi:hypothetical protein